jgi:hypothetical protein
LATYATPFEEMDHFVAAARTHGMKVRMTNTQEMMHPTNVAI